MDDGKAASFRPKLSNIPNYGDAEEPAPARFPARRTMVMGAGAIAILTIAPLLWSLSMGAEENTTITTSAVTDMAEPHSMAVHDDNGEMVGQLAKMPGDTDRGLQVESVSQADKHSGKELMKIIGKY